MGDQKARLDDRTPSIKELTDTFIHTMTFIGEIPDVDDALDASDEASKEDKALDEHRTYLQVAMDDAMALIEDMVERVKAENPKYRVTDQTVGIYRALYNARSDLKKPISHADAKQKLFHYMKTGRWLTPEGEKEKNVPPRTLPLSALVLKEAENDEMFESVTKGWLSFARMVGSSMQTPTAQVVTNGTKSAIADLASSFAKAHGNLSEDLVVPAAPATEEKGKDLVGRVQDILPAIPEEYRYIVEETLQTYINNDHQDSEHGCERKYLTYVAGLPWNKTTQTVPSLSEARQVLDESHYGLDKPKEAIRLFLSDLLYRGSDVDKMPVLCLNGLPGTGKTSLGKSIAKALGREFFSIAAGSGHDSSQMKGSRKTYIGADIGDLMKSLFRLGVKNPVIFLDEVDKVESGGYNGNPFAPLMEMLDPEQNTEFMDDFLEIPFDLSQVLFVCGTNDVSALPGPLKDRMDVIEVPGYLFHEKIVIAENYILPRIMKGYSNPPSVTFEEGVFADVIHNHTDEGGLRQLERCLRTLVKTGVDRLMEGNEKSVEIRRDELPKILGQALLAEKILAAPLRGYVNGLYVSASGGGILPMEAEFAPRMPGDPFVKITGNLLKVMTESTQNAITTAMNLAKEYLGEDKLKEKLKGKTIHVNAPDAVEKDGPSAGTALTLTIFSLIADIAISNTVTLTGEITLKQHVLAIGGVREKLSGAIRAGAKKALVPAANKAQVDDLPAAIKNDIEIVQVEYMKEVLREGLVKDPFPDWRPEQEVGFRPVHRSSSPSMP